ncbi:MAG: cobalamin biosynthesis protein CbiX [Tabrizicola sp.]|nr:cobalamin biosynthesis protein CbiX [Tabrizicola sp.]
MTQDPVLILAHGQPSDPLPAAKALAEFAAKVARELPGHAVTSATLAGPGALENALAGRPTGLVYPMFMAGGWFTRVQVPVKLAEAGVAAGENGWQVLEPFGCDPQVHDLCVTLAREAGARGVVLAAHGSGRSPVPSDVAHHVARRIADEAGVGRVAVGFIDQSPQLSSLTGFGAEAVCLPFFAAEGGHVTEDLPKALGKAGFQGRILPPVGLDPRVPGIVAAAIAQGKTVCAETCNWAAIRP